MMKKIALSICTTMIMATCLVSTVRAQEKIALVSLQSALNDVNEGKRTKETLKKDYEGKKKQIDAMKLELDKLSQDLDKQKMVLSEDALQTKRKDLQAKFIELQNKAATFERELKTKEAESAKKILTSLREVVLQISQSGGYSLVIENSSETVLFSKSGEDITPKVIAEYNKKFK